MAQYYVTNLAGEKIPLPMTPEQFRDLILERNAAGLFPSVVENLSGDREGVPECAYRADNNRRCVMGIVIPDTLYTKAMETKAASKLFYDLIPLEPHEIVRGFTANDFNAAQSQLHDSHVMRIHGKMRWNKRKCERATRKFFRQRMKEWKLRDASNTTTTTA